ncbi:hypothetical protein [Bacillus sp. AK031]
MSKLLRSIIVTIIILSAVIYYIGNYTLIHKDKLKEVTISEKLEKSGHYYIVAGDMQLEVKDENLWNVIKEKASYDIEYEWYGDHVPSIKYISLHGQKQSGDESH